MKILEKRLKQGEITILLESADDAWYLSTVIEEGDTLKGKTLRKIKVGSSETSTDSVKRPVFLSISAAKTDFTGNELRVSGTVIEGPEDVPHGSHHSFHLEPGVSVTIIKQSWPSYQLDRITEAAESPPAPVLVVVMDREEALFALLKRQGYELLLHLKGTVSKKGVDEAVKNQFYQEIILKMQEYDKRHSFSRIILASPIFWKEELMKELSDAALKKKLIQATCSSVDANGITEVLKRPETQEALKQARIAKEIAAVDSLLTGIAKTGLATYGLGQVTSAVEAGAVKTLLVSAALIAKSRADKTYPTIEMLLKSVESMDGTVVIISSDHDAGTQLDGLGGIGAVLRYKLA